MHAKFHHNIPLSSRDSAIITFFRIWSSAKPRPKRNVISQFLGLDLVNINVCSTDYESMRKDTLEFAKEKYFNGHSDTRSVQENFDLLTFFIQDSADKHIPSKTSRSVSSIPWITPEIRRKIRRKNKTHAKAKKTGSSKLRSKFETLRREIKADVRKQHDLYVNNLVGDVKANPETSIGTSIVRKKTPKVFHPWKGRMERVLLSRVSKRQRNSMVSSRMCSIKMNTPRSRFWIGLTFYEWYCCF